MLSVMLSKIINYLLYQIGWFCCILGAAWGYPITGSFLALLLIVVHLILSESPKAEIKMMCCACLLGVVLDSSQQALGVFSFKNRLDWPLGLPLWVLMIWGQFATLFHYALSWLSGRYLLAALLGLVGGPLAYWGGVRLGAAVFGDNLLFSIVTLALVWALVIPLFIWLSGRIDSQKGCYRKFFWWGVRG